MFWVRTAGVRVLALTVLCCIRRTLLCPGQQVVNGGRRELGLEHQVDALQEEQKVLLAVLSQR
jgi:hypothetical protein